MIKPTPAQIEAAALAIRELLPTSLKVVSDQLAEAALAAAQVGEPTESERWRAVASHIEAVTIERCAQVAESPTFGKDGQAAAAAIRKLKDAP